MTDLCESCSKFRGCVVRETNENEIRIPIEECSSYRSTDELEYASLQDVHDVLLKWFPALDTTRIDTRLAWYRTNKYGIGDPVWIFELARSGLTKTTLTNAFLSSPKILEMDQITAKTLCSGAVDKKGKSVPDFGMKLNQRNRCVIVNESAYIKSMKSGDQRETFAVLKRLHDGIIKRDTGSGISKEYRDCNTSFWFNSTKDFRNQLIIQQEIGTCFLIDEIPTNLDKDEAMILISMANRNKEKSIRKETSDIVSRYLAHHPLKLNVLTKEDMLFIMNESDRLKYLRCTTTYDRLNEIERLPDPEMPARVSKQISKMMESLLSLDEEYNRDRAIHIIKRIVDSTGDNILASVLQYIDWFRHESRNIEFSIPDVQNELRLGTGTVKRRLELLVGLGFLNKVENDSGRGRPGFSYKVNQDKDIEDWEKLLGCKEQ